MTAVNLAEKISLWNPVHFFSLGFGSGLFPRAPGTFGTLAAIPLVLALSLVSWPMYAAIVVISGVVGIWMCAYTSKAMKVPDHPSIVWDEIVGFAIAMFMLPMDAITIVLAFIIFRFLDIVKPGPIGWCDIRLSGGLGIMLDDVLAGIATALILHGGYWLIG